MHRLLVALLAAVDAALAVAVGLAATLAPLTLLWVFGLGGTADWAALWPAGVAVWQFGNLVPLAVTLPAEYLAATGIDPAAASFTLSLAPLAFAAFTAIFAARSGARASHADAWLTGVLTGSGVFAALTAGVALTSGAAIVHAETWQAILVPTLVFALPALVAAAVTEWREAGAGVVARLRDRVEASGHGWGPVPALVARGSAVVVAGLVGLGAAITATALIARAGQVVALYEAGNVDVLGAIVLTLAQLAYLPTLVVWGMTFVAGPGFAIGDGTAVSAAGTQVGVVPGIPLLGAIPESSTSWLLLLTLLPVALGAFAGWIVRSRLAHGAERIPDATPARAPVASFDAARTSALEGLLASATRDEPAVAVTDRAEGHAQDRAEDPIAPRLVIAVAIAVVAAAVAALLATLASGSLGPGSLAHIGPDPGPVALAVGAEVLVGAAILLLSPRNGSRRRDARGHVEVPDGAGERHPEPAAGAGASDRVESPGDRREPAAFAPIAGAFGESPGDRRGGSGRIPHEAASEAASEATTEPIELPPKG